MKIALATDHAGFELKENLKLILENEGHVITDCGAYELNKEDDYPEYIAPAAQALIDGSVDRAIIFGGSGEGEAMVANRFQGVRATVYYGGNDAIIRLSREHNDANVLSLGARFVSEEEAKMAVLTWLALPGPTEERHLRRVRKVDGIAQQ